MKGQAPTNLYCQRAAVREISLAVFSVTPRASGMLHPYTCRADRLAASPAYLPLAAVIAAAVFALGFAFRRQASATR